MYRLRIFFSWKVAYLLIICQDVWTKSISVEESETLQLVHILFRHGERTNVRFALYPKDPYINETYSPYGLGELTREGKKTEYRLGKILHERYDKFLGKTYRPSLVEAWSSDTNRTKVSLMLLLAGLFPPTAEEIWEEGLLWQPIPFNQHPVKEDLIFFGIISCPKYRKEREKHLQSEKMMKELRSHRKLFQFLSEETGWNITDFGEIFRLYIGLKVEEEWGLELPPWTKSVYPQPLEDLASQLYLSLTATTDMRRIASGYLLKKIIDDTRSKINNEEFIRQRKIFLYSGHEFNLAALLATLDIFDTPHVPNYGSYIIFEVHKINDTDGVKIYYQDNKTQNGPELLKLPACDSFCEFGKFVSLIQEYLPTSESCGTESECKSNSVK